VYAVDPFPGKSGKMQDVRSLSQGLPEQRRNLGEKAAGEDQPGPMHQV
jgi:hypothetical protein